MLSIFEGLDEEKYVVWVKDDNSELNLLVSDGQEVWRSPHPVTSRDKPASRKHESDEVFLSQLKRALKRDASNAPDSFSVEIKAVESDIQLVVKETIGTTTTKSILFKCTLERSVEQKTLFLKMFSEASEKMQNDLLEVHSLNKSIAEYASLVDTLSNTTKDMTSLKEKLHDELISKFCMVLNTKKREIERLNERIDELESQYESVQNTQQSLINLTQSSSTAPPKAAPKATAKATVKAAPRGRAAALKAATTPLECATGSKRKAATKVAPASKRKTPARKNRRGQSESESEEEEEGDETSESEDDASGAEESDGASHSTGQSEQEGDLFEDIAPPIVTQSQKSTLGTQPSSNLSSPVTSRKSSSRAKSVSENETSCVKMTSSSSHNTVSAPIVTTETTRLQSVEEEESEEELLHSRPRVVKAIPAELPVVSKAAQSVSAGSTSSVKPLVTQSSIPAASAKSAKSSKSKFYEEESEDEGNCMDYI